MHRSWVQGTLTVVVIVLDGARLDDLVLINPVLVGILLVPLFVGLLFRPLLVETLLEETMLVGLLLNEPMLEGE